MIIIDLKNVYEDLRILTEKEQIDNIKRLVKTDDIVILINHRSMPPDILSNFIFLGKNIVFAETLKIDKVYEVCCV